MNNLQKTLLVAGAIGLGSAVAAPAFADTQAYASGSSTIVLMNGASQSIGAEIAAPAGLAFAAGTGITVTPVLFTTLDSNFNSFIASPSFVNAGAVTAPVGIASSSVEAAVATQINVATAAQLQAGVSYTRAWRSGLQ